ncbi:GntR family transcriptional regulator [Aquabacterium sp.]|uniref:GntR family transcriptional regulator n=1 Tax=Aquabacterium sp. TaxID=1872578 RepID=UPI002CEE94C8|nr:GntR family transcriptional regulator [Aquabacterium sp.]HSW09139.1 GntR family transcriptional regulator [Aquabacterium sp.]
MPSKRNIPAADPREAVVPGDPREAVAPSGTRSQTALDELVNRIALDIQGGVFGPGTWLKQVDLEARYACTRIDLRRALDRLVANRLVEHVHNRGYHVYEADSRVYAELQDIRIVLELRAAELIEESATPADVRELRRLAKRFDELLLDGTVFEQYEANIAFHRRMLAMCSNHELAEMIMAIRRRGPSAPIFQWKTRARMEQSSREHFAMVDAIEAHQPARLQKLLREHIQQTESAERQSPSALLPTRLSRKAG